MGMNKDYFRFSREVLQDKRWPPLRLAAKRRDGFKCVQCGARGRLEVDHIQPVRYAPELAFVLENLQTLCVSCHSKKTIQEIGLRNSIPHREKWIESVEQLSKGFVHADFAKNRPPPVGNPRKTCPPCWD